MIIIRYALVIRDNRDKCLASFGTGTEPLRQAHKSKVTPGMHRLLSSAFNMHSDAASIDVVSLEGWRAGEGMDLDLQPVVLAARRTEQAGTLAFCFPGGESEVAV